MTETIIVLIGIDGRHEVLKQSEGIAFAISKLSGDRWLAVYVATSAADAESAIAHYSDAATLNDFVSQ